LPRKTSPTDSIRHLRTGHLTDADRRRIVKIREQSAYGAIEVTLKAFVRPAGGSRRFVPLPSATTTIEVKAALNAEQIITGGPIAGKNFTATDAILELYENTYREKK